MGCDIHVIAEVRHNGQWAPVTDVIFVGGEYDRKSGQPYLTEPFGWRSYLLFTFFAGVRDDGRVAPLAYPRGLPVDCHPGTREELDWYGLHSHSWLSVADLDVDYTTRVPDGFGDQYFAHLDTLRSLGHPDDVRIVFAFDS